MKSIILLAACSLFISVSAYAQKIASDKVPPPVHAAFKAKFPAAEKTEWEMENDQEYEAEFKVGTMEQSARFDRAGKWLETETEIKVSELPQAVQDALAKEFVGFKIEEACKVEDVLHGSVYEAEVEKGKEEYDVLVDASGKVLKKESEKPEEGDKED